MEQASDSAARAQQLVRVTTHERGGPYFIELLEALEKPVCIGPYDNPSIANAEAKQIRAYLAALLAQ